MTRAFANVFAIALLAPPLACQVATELSFGDRTPRDRRLHATATALQATTGPGGFESIGIDLENPDSEPHRVAVYARSEYFENFDVVRTVDVAARAEVTVHLPLLQNPARRYEVRFAVDGYDRGNTINVNLAPHASPAVSALLVADDPRAEAGWKAMFQARVNGVFGTGTGIVFQHRAADRLPDDWIQLSGFDLIFVDGVSSGLDRGAQQVLRRYLTAGGNVCVFSADSLRDGPLKRAIDGDRPREIANGAAGFGRFARIGDDSSMALPGRLPPGVGLLVAGGIELAAGGFSGPLPGALYSPLAIPGLGQMSLELFFLVILVFAVAVGPVNYFMWWRRKRLTMLLATVPVAGFGLTALILLYGLFSEGFGIKGVIRSVTILDQRVHEAVTWTGRTLYAGLSPSRVQPGAHTYVSGPGLFTTSSRSFQHRMSLDYDRPGARIDGSLVPSRLPTTIATSAQGPQRARLRFRRRDDGGMDVLSGPELTPRGAGAEALILRDVDGRYYVGGAGRRGLQPTSQRRAIETAERLCQSFAVALHVDDTSYHEAYRVFGVSLSELRNRMLQVVRKRLLASLAPGAYLAVVEDSPAVDRLGLDVDYLESIHLVLGRLGEEDVVD